MSVSMIIFCAIEMSLLFVVQSAPEPADCPTATPVAASKKRMRSALGWSRTISPSRILSPALPVARMTFTGGSPTKAATKRLAGRR